jgi:hypothetical protein
MFSDQHFLLSSESPPPIIVKELSKSQKAKSKDVAATASLLSLANNENKNK